MNFLSDFWLFLNQRKRFWLLPIVILLGLFCAFIVMFEGTAVGPFIYVLF
jgi:hypothetical protein